LLFWCVCVVVFFCVVVGFVVLCRGVGLCCFVCLLVFVVGFVFSINSIGWSISPVTGLHAYHPSTHTQTQTHLLLALQEPHHVMGEAAALGAELARPRDEQRAAQAVPGLNVVGPPLPGPLLVHPVDGGGGVIIVWLLLFGWFNRVARM
jgi:hypothetical protein